MNKRIATLLALFLLAGCGGGGGGSSSVPGSPAQTQSKTATGSVVISIPVASSATATLSRTARYPQFVSPNASSVTLSINGGTATVFDVSTTSSLCTTVGSTRNCTLSFGAPVGSDTFAFVIFQGTNGTGAQLASATTTQSIAAATAFNFTVALNAAIGTLIANVTETTGGASCPNSPVGANAIYEGCSGGAPVVYTVLDPSGAAVTGTAPYATSITIAASDPSVTAVPATITAPGQTVTITYNGAAFASTITNSVTINLTIGTSVIPFFIPVKRQYLYVAHSNAPVGTTPTGSGAITVYQFGASGAVTPVRTISGGPSTITTPIKPLVDSTGVLYVLDNNIPTLGPPVRYNPSISVFAPGANGGINPIRQITGIGSVSGNQPCSDMTFDPTGNFLFVACGLDFFVFPVTANTTASSAVTASFEDDSGSTSNAIQFDQSGNLYIADSNLNNIRIYTAPITTSGGFHLIGAAGSMDGAPGGSAWPSDVKPFFIALDNAGKLYAPVWSQIASTGSGDNDAELALWNPGNVCNNCVPNASLTFNPFNVHAVDGVVLDAAGNVYVDNMFTNQVTEFSAATIAGATIGTSALFLRTLTNNAPAIPGSSGMAIGP